MRGATTTASGQRRERLAAAHGGAHPEGLGLVAGRQHDPAAHDHGPSPQYGVVALFDRGVERVEVGVQDCGVATFAPGHGHEHMFAAGQVVAAAFW